jgi:hypothetical protein
MAARLAVKRNSQESPLQAPVGKIFEEAEGKLH